MRNRLQWHIALFLSAWISVATRCPGDVVVDWNKVMSEVVLADQTIQNPGMASRTMAMTNIAMYDAINGITRTHQSFYQHEQPAGAAAPEPAAVQAAHCVLSGIYPAQQGLLDDRLSAALVAFPDDDVTAAGINFGNAVCTNVLAERASDGFDQMVAYMPIADIGHWQPDPLNPGQEAWGPEWGKIQPFSIPSSQSMMPPSMPSVTTDQYTAAFNEVKELGALESAARSDEQTIIGKFWAYDRLGMGTPMQLYNQVLRNVAVDQGNSLTENARLFALASTSIADAGIVAWDSKFEYDFWRPVTGIRAAGEDGNPDTVPDADWVPLGAPGGELDDGTLIPDFTPPFPTYVSGHASFGGALFGSLQSFYGTDDISFDIASKELGGMVRTYDSFTEAMIENGRSRVYLGIHWNFDDVVARDLGLAVSEYVAANRFKPVPEPRLPTAVFLPALVFLLRTPVVRRP